MVKMPGLGPVSVAVGARAVTATTVAKFVMRILSTRLKARFAAFGSVEAVLLMSNWPNTMLAPPNAPLVLASTRAMSRPSIE